MIQLGQPELELAKKISHEVWQKYDDTHGYRTEKQEYNAKVSTENPDNIWFFWGQFDSNNHQEFYDRLLDKHSDDPGAPKLMAWAVVELNRDHEALERLHEAGIDL